MDDVTNFTEKILGYKTWSDKKKIDALLEYDCNMYTQLGIDSTKQQITETKKKSRIIYRAIGKIDKASGQTFLWYMDKR